MFGLKIGKDKMKKVYSKKDPGTLLGIIHRFDEIPEGRVCLLYTSPSPRDVEESRMPSSA